MGATKEANLISAVLRYAVRCLADGDREALRAMNFGPKEIEALAAWYDHVITDTNGEIALAEERLSAPIAVVDIGGRATDYVVVADRSGRGPRRLRLAALRPAGREEAGRGWHPRQV